MATEILSIPEEHVAEVITVIRAGIDATDGFPGIALETVRNLKSWCDEEEAYYSSKAWCDESEGRRRRRQ